MSERPDSEQEEQIPVYPGAVLGYRAWQLTDNGLMSAGAGGWLWHPGVNKAICMRGREHDAPSSDCHCGMYLWNDLHRAYHLEKFGLQHDKHRLVVGAVLARGRAEVHHDGVRAEQAQIIALHVPDYLSNWEKKNLQRIAAEHKVPLFDDELQMQQYAEQFASPVPEDLRPPHPAIAAMMQFIPPPPWMQLTGLLLTALVISLLRKRGKISAVTAAGMYALLAPQLLKVLKQLEQELFSN